MRIQAWQEATWRPQGTQPKEQGQTWKKGGVVQWTEGYGMLVTWQVDQVIAVDQLVEWPCSCVAGQSILMGQPVNLSVTEAVRLALWTLGKKDDGMGIPLCFTLFLPSFSSHSFLIQNVPCTGSNREYLKRMITMWKETRISLLGQR